MYGYTFCAFGIFVLGFETGLNDQPSPTRTSLKKRKILSTFDFSRAQRLSTFRKNLSTFKNFIDFQVSACVREARNRPKVPSLCGSGLIFLNWSDVRRHFMTSDVIFCHFGRGQGRGELFHNARYSQLHLSRFTAAIQRFSSVGNTFIPRAYKRAQRGRKRLILKQAHLSAKSPARSARHKKNPCDCMGCGLFHVIFAQLPDNPGRKIYYKKQDPKYQFALPPVGKK